MLTKLLSEYSINAQFTEGDPVYEWIIHFMVSLLPPSI